MHPSLAWTLVPRTLNTGPSRAQRLKPKTLESLPNPLQRTAHRHRRQRPPLTSTEARCIPQALKALLCVFLEHSTSPVERMAWSPGQRQQIPRKMNSCATRHRLTPDIILNSSPKETEPFVAVQEGAPSPGPFQSTTLPCQKKKNPERSNFLLLGYPFKSSVLSHQVILFLKSLYLICTSRRAFQFAM